ncbi:tyrosine-protein phosphatase [Granulicella tundricola]|uniref:protein-tyrosine-phosphatase n=1 Tax=Granulicella tundricola (strain ATCC BAA-1859 / DSM 23138 / MP5ACTX9) TaxID=1198114 RepID=E8WVE3_GRATM|nr:CpsB/CapC family capsule biosynthesis tyrosine phosphatase [Granulicella tundricola]ADW68391.1 Protein-tyrosine-phosphatase [Granulicella tundricola MP5ACTX9]
MVDIHHHLLWGLDDGAKDFETSVAMAKASAADGVTEIVCTPHANGKFNFDPMVNAAKAAQLQARLDADGIKLKVGLGCDFHLSYDNILEAKENPTKFSVNGLGYLMVEIPDYGVPRGLNETFYELQLVGLTPVLTHPERNPTLQSDLPRLAEWMRGGVLVQVTGDSVTGKMGKDAEKMAHTLLSRRWVHFLATDAHNVSSRPPRLSEARDLVARKYGSEYADSLVETNPRAVFDGTRFEAQAEPLGLYEEFKDTPWWRRILDSVKS